MKFIASFMGLCFLVVSVGQAQTRRASALQPTPLEAFARQPTTHVAWSKEVGRLDSREAHAIVTVIVLEDSARPPDRMRGIRIDLSSPVSKDTVYLGEETLAAYRNALDGIARYASSSRNTARDEVGPGGTHYLGAELFWYGDHKPRVHALNAAYYFAPDSEGLSVSAFKDTEFRFPYLDPSQFAGAIARAIAQLKSR